MSKRNNQRTKIKIGPVTMGLWGWLLVACSILFAFVGPPPTPTPDKPFEPSPTMTATVTYTPSITPSPTITLTPTITFTPSNIPSPTLVPPTSTPRPTDTPLPPPTEPPPPTEAPNPWAGCPEITCGQFSSCSQVREYLRYCPQYWGARDRNGDGIPCESLCGG
jgi:hypothetical protein